MNTPVTKNLTRIEHWLRAFYVVFFVLCVRLASLLMDVLALCQIVFSLFTGEPNRRLVQLGSGLAIFIYQVNLFISAKSEIKPFPFADWPADQDLTQVRSAESRAIHAEVIAEQATGKPCVDAADCNDGAER